MATAIRLSQVGRWYEIYGNPHDRLSRLSQIVAASRQLKLANETADHNRALHARASIRILSSGQADDTEYPQALAAFARSLETANIPFANRGRAFDAAGAQGHSGLFAIAITLGPVAIIQLTKLIHSFLAHSDRKIKLTKGAVKLEGSVKDLQTLLTPEQIQQLIEAKRPNCLEPLA